MKIIEHIVSDNIADNIEKILLCPEMPWYFQRKTVDTSSLNVNIDGYSTTPFFRHQFYRDFKQNSEFLSHIDPLVFSIIDHIGSNDVRFFSISANLVVPDMTLTGMYSVPHIDVDWQKELYEEYDTYTGLYYVHDCDGDTVFFNEFRDVNNWVIPETFTEYKTISPKKNRFCYWDSNQYHSAPATASEPRIVINFNFIVKKNKEE